MSEKTRIKIFTDRYPLIGPSVWILSIQYFVVQIIVALHYTPTYSVRFNTISDLGNTVCGIYSGRVVCSPLHNLMNASFIVVGLTMTLGSVLIYQEFKQNQRTFIGFSCMALAGLGTIIVGLFPENTVSQLHILGATLPFLIGNIGLVVLGLSLNIPRIFRYYTILSGGVALIALAFFYTNHYGSLGIGGTERVVAYPQTIWLIVFGIYLSKSRFKTLLNNFSSAT
jgi:hypothetical membrane protein